MYSEDKRFEGMLTHDECLFSRVTDKRLLELIEKYPVVEQSISCNSYGEFIFVTLKLGDHTVTFHSLGYHEYRDTYFIDEWEMDNSYDKPNVSLSKKEVLQIMEERRQVIKKESESHKQSNKGHVFSELADVGDDDGALAMLEDFGYM